MGKILIVEDNETTVKFLISVLSSKGHLSAHCIEPRDAMEKLKSEHYDLIISDVMMPGGITGFDFVRTVRALPAFADIPILLVTGRRERKDVEKGIKSGADDYLIKPIDPDILLSKIDGLLLKKGKSSTQFARGTTKTPAAWDVPTEIVEISEIGLVVHSALPAPPGLKLKLNSTFFSEVGIESPFLRVVSCEHRVAQGLYYITLHFVGVSEKDLTPIRLWIRSSLLTSRVS